MISIDFVATFLSSTADLLPKRKMMDRHLTNGYIEYRQRGSRIAVPGDHIANFNNGFMAHP
jgi:hypothetical protein